MLAQLDEALNHYNMAIDINSQNGEYIYNRGLVNSRLDQVPEVIRDYEQAIKYLPQSDEESKYQAHFNKGICLRRLGKLADSIKDLEKARLMKPDRSSVHNNLGLSYFEYEMYEEALQSYGNAIKNDTNDEAASVHYNNRGLAYYHDKKLQEA